MMTPAKARLIIGSLRDERLDVKLGTCSRAKWLTAAATPNLTLPADLVAFRAFITHASEATFANWQNG